VWIKPNANPHQGEVLTNAHEYILLFGDGFDEDAVRTPYSEETVLRYGRRFVNHSGVKGDGRGAHDSRPQRTLNERGARGKSFFLCYTGREKGNKHPAPMPLDLAEHLVKLSGGQKVLDPFAGSGTTLLAARRLGRSGIGIEFLSEYAEMAAERLAQQTLLGPQASSPDRR
jgi:DNA modification methylase